MEPTLRKALAERLRAESPTFADALNDPKAQLTEVPAPFLRNVRLVRVEWRLPSRPVVFYIGYRADAPETARALTGQPKAFAALLKSDDVRIGDATAAAALGRAFLETTRLQSRRELLLETPDDLPWMPDLDDADEARREEVLRKMPKRLTPSAAPAEGGFLVTAWMVDEMDLQVVRLHVATDGTIQVDRRPLATELPFTETL